MHPEPAAAADPVGIVESRGGYPHAAQWTAPTADDYHATM
jgi:hypothetical protein